jgi:hypothetical protein
MIAANFVPEQCKIEYQCPSIFKIHKTITLKIARLAIESASQRDY